MTQYLSLISIPYRQAKNPIVFFLQSNYTKFQFLIGRLKTKQKKQLYGEYKISIPYRQAKNGYGKGIGQVFKTVSIPYRQAKNEQQDKEKEVEKGVSIPYRQAKNTSYKAKTFYFRWFQFLIGRLKTAQTTGRDRLELCFNSLQVG